MATTAHEIEPKVFSKKLVYRNLNVYAYVVEQSLLLKNLTFHERTQNIMIKNYFIHAKVLMGVFNTTFVIIKPTRCYLHQELQQHVI